MSNTLKPAETYTHTHTHTGKSLNGKKQIGTICFSKILIFSTILIFIGLTDSHSTDVGLTWYDGNSTISGATSCTVGGTFVPPTPPARPGYVFTGWRVKEIHAPAVEKCGIDQLDTGTGGSAYGYARLNGNTGTKESNYGLTTGSGQWATEFSYGTVWGMAKCSETSGNNSSGTWPESSKSDWLKTPSDTTGQYCWCQATGFTASGNSYTSGPQCTTTASSLWVFFDDRGSSDGCAYDCAYNCTNFVRIYAAFRAGLFGSVAQ